MNKLLILLLSTQLLMVVCDANISKSITNCAKLMDDQTYEKLNTCLNEKIQAKSMEIQEMMSVCEISQPKLQVTHQCKIIYSH